jgi:hypothetical protein
MGFSLLDFKKALGGYPVECNNLRFLMYNILYASGLTSIHHDI